ncbi:class I adenylate-forming enzyme family protein [Aquabacterium sp.]|uniref:class I adenylate-forming enzyme family protein n=1 Tax=Aquabacterium sp. TaxID=1872578 RepID=UPI00248A36F2|nr:class I adenylate-forming enzyme family protein [Aquabacterium sp.]MDI1259895.1 class I adenylate-forming enzyme family protein [Aquabacterium sp.]
MSTLLHHFFDQTCARLPDKTALVCGEQRHSHAQLREQVDQLALRLQQRGVQRGDRVTLFLDNTVEMVVGIFAALKVGAVFMPVNPLTKQDKLAYLLNDARASALITQSSLASVYQAALALNDSVHTVLVAGLSEALDERTLPFTGQPGQASWQAPALIDQDLASIIYTSGSTGDPKGVMLSHLNMVSATRSVSTYLGLQEDDIILCALPLAFDYGLYQVLMAFAVGATVVLERSFTFPVKVLEVMAREKVTAFPGVPTMFSMLMNLKSLDHHGLSSLRMITNTAAALPEERIRQLRELFPQALLFSMYGLTECKRVTYLPPDQLDARPTSVGRGMPNEEVWLVDDAGQRLPNGSLGELVIRGSNVMRGYWEKPLETAKRLKPGPLPGEMVLYSGDLFRTDAEGYLYFVSRKDDIIKSRGEKVSPREVENALYAHQGVYEAAVVGVPDELLGQAVKAFVVLKAGVTLSERDVIKHCLSRLESFMAPKHVEFVASLPTTDTGKIKKTGLN